MVETAGWVRVRRHRKPLDDRDGPVGGNGGRVLDQVRVLPLESLKSEGTTGVGSVPSVRRWYLV